MSSSSISSTNPRNSQALSSGSPSSCSTSLNSDSDKPAPPTRTMDHNKQRSARPRWLSQIKEWLFVSEPSAQAMKDQRTKAYKHFGIDANDPQAAVKMHLPMGKIPAGATTSTAGPTPEQAHVQSVREKQKRRSFMSLNTTTYSLSSHGSERSSVRVPNQVTPWE